MPTGVTTYRVFIASPAGLEPERRAFREALRDWNDMVCLDRAVAFHPIGWEDTLPGKGRPQGLINDDVRKCDYMILLLWDRWGTPPGGDGAYTSGTEEEYAIAMAAIADEQMPMRQVVVLFKGVDARQMSDPGEQLKNVLDFRKRLEREKTLLYGTFDTPQEFAKHIERQLWRWLSDHERGGSDSMPEPAPGGPLVPDTSCPPEALPPEPDVGERLPPAVKQAEQLADEGRLAEAEALFSTAILRQSSAASYVRYARFLHRVGRFDMAEVMLREAERIAAASGDEEERANAIRWLGNILRGRGALREAEEKYREALAIDERPGHREGMARDYGNLGLIYRTRGDLTQAEAMLRKALAINEELGRREGMAAQYGNLGLIYQTRGDLTQAEAMLRKALAINEELGRREGMANQYGNLGLIYRTRGDLTQAEAMLRKALAIDEELGHREGMASDYGNLGLIYQTRGDLTQAETMLGKALAIHEELGHCEGMAREYGNLGLIYQTRGDLTQAEAMHRKSLAIEEELGHREGMASDYGNLGAIYQTRGDLAQARAHWEKARDLFAQIGMQPELEQVEGWLRDLPPQDAPAAVP